MIDQCRIFVEDLPDRLSNGIGLAFGYAGDEYMYFVCDYEQCEKPLSAEYLTNSNLQAFANRRETIIKQFGTKNLSGLFREVKINIKCRRSDDHQSTLITCADDADMADWEETTVFQYYIKGLALHSEERRAKNRSELQPFLTENTDDLLKALKEQLLDILKEYEQEYSKRGFFSKDVRIYLHGYKTGINPNTSQLYFGYCDDAEPGTAEWEWISNSVRAYMEKSYKTVHESFKEHNAEMTRQTVDPPAEAGTSQAVVSQMGVFSSAEVVSFAANIHPLPGGHFAVIVKAVLPNDGGKDANPFISDFARIIQYAESFFEQCVKKDNQLKNHPYTFFNLRAKNLAAAPEQ